MSNITDIAAGEVSDYMTKILKLFKDPNSKITVFVRNSDPDQDFMLTNDNGPAMVEAIGNRIKRGHEEIE